MLDIFFWTFIIPNSITVFCIIQYQNEYLSQTIVISLEVSFKLEFRVRLCVSLGVYFSICLKVDSCNFDYICDYIWLLIKTILLQTIHHGFKNSFHYNFGCLKFANRYLIIQCYSLWHFLFQILTSFSIPFNTIV